MTPRYTSSPFEVVVDAAGRRFQYWHIHRDVREGEYVRAQETVLGYVVQEARHVHLSEIRGLVVQNPLAPGHLTPYRDSTPPVVAELVVRDVHGRAVSLLQLRGRVRLSALAYEIPGLRTAPDPVERDFKPKTPNRLWCAGVTYVRTCEKRHSTIDYYSPNAARRRRRWPWALKRLSQDASGSVS